MKWEAVLALVVATAVEQCTKVGWAAAADQKAVVVETNMVVVRTVRAHCSTEFVEVEQKSAEVGQKLVVVVPVALVAMNNSVEPTVQFHYSFECIEFVEAGQKLVVLVVMNNSVEKTVHHCSFGRLEVVVVAAVEQMLAVLVAAVPDNSVATTVDRYHFRFAYIEVVEGASQWKYYLERSS